MSQDALQQIRTDLGEESRTRQLRAWTAAGVVLAVGFGLGIGMGVRPLMSQDLLALAVGATLIVVSLALTGGRRAPRYSVPVTGVLGAAAVLSPFLSARTVVPADHSDLLHGTLGCMSVGLGVGLLALVLLRLVLGRFHRRFGSAPWLTALAAALAGVLTLALHCPMSHAVHLAGHALAAALVVGSLGYAMRG